jgi:hypothetical protein
MNKPARDILIRHIDGSAVFWPMPHSIRDPIQRALYPGRLKTRDALIAKGWIVFGGAARLLHHTYITNAGRLALARALADWADALITVGFVVEDKGNCLDARLAQIFHNSPRTQAEQTREESFA